MTKPTPLHAVEGGSPAARAARLRQELAAYDREQAEMLARLLGEAVALAETIKADCQHIGVAEVARRCATTLEPLALTLQTLIPRMA